MITATSEVEAKHSEVLKGTEATISCVVTGLTKQLDAVVWEKPNNGGTITNNVDDYKIEVGTYQESSHSQTTILTVPSAANQANPVFTCVITSSEHQKTADKTPVTSNTFSKFLKFFPK
jgi:t-SNARE complex subunit (syntaxin)